MNTKTNSKPRRRLLNLAVLMALGGGGALVPALASAADLYWACGSASWDATCWSTTPPPFTPSAALPQGSDTAHLTQSGSTGLTVDYRNSSTTPVLLHGLFIDATGPGTMTLSQTQDSLAAFDEAIGLSGTGAFNQSGGTNMMVNGLRLGNNSGSNGTYNLSGITSSLSATTYEIIGLYGTGTFNQSGGTNTVDGFLALAGGPGSNGTYNLSGGTLNVGGYIRGGSVSTFNLDGGTLNLTGSFIGLSTFNIGHASGSNGSFTLGSGQTLKARTETIGYDGSIGAFTQNDGTHTVDYLSIGSGGGSGSYNLSAGSLSSNSEDIGSYYGSGAFTQTGGTHTVSGNLTLGSGGFGAGSYNLSAGDLTASNETIGEYSYGDFTQSGGTNTTGLLVLGQYAGSGGTYNFTGGTLYNNVIVGDAGTGVFTNSGGTHNVAGDLILGRQSTGNGTYSLSSSGSVSANNEFIGAPGTGTFNQTGGANTAAFGIFIGDNSGSNGTYNLSGDSLTTLTVANETIGLSGTGTFNQNGGIHTVTGTMTLAADPGSSGTYNFTGGTLTAGSIVNNVGGEFNQSGATTVTANVTNNGAYNVSGGGVNTVAGDFINNGTVKVTSITEGTTVIFTGTFDNHGAYISDPSSNYFTDLIVGSTGYLIGGTGDNFFIGNNFTNNSANALWNTRNARLVFDTGTDSLHDFTLGGLAGTDPFSWGTLELASGNMLNLFGSSLYVDTLILGSGADLNLDGVTLYYRHLLNHGGAIGYSHGGQFLAWGGGPSTTPVPEPETWAMLLAGLGLLGFAGRRRKVRWNA